MNASNQTITLDNPQIPVEDWDGRREHILISGFKADGSVVNLQCRVARPSEGATSPPTYEIYAVDAGGSFSDIEAGLSVVRADGDMIMIEAVDDGGNSQPRISGYDNVLGHVDDSPVYGFDDNPDWRITPEGIYYDGFIKHIYNRQEVAGFSSGDIVAVPDNSSWKERITLVGNGVGNDSGWQRKIASKYVHKNAFRQVLVNGSGAIDVDQDENIITGHTLHIRLDVGGLSFTRTVSAGTSVDINETSSLTHNDPYFVELYMRIEATVNESGGHLAANVTGHIYEDIEINAVTGNA